jgi:hypothetical protein
VILIESTILAQISVVIQSFLTVAVASNILPNFRYFRQKAGVKIINSENISNRPNSIANVQIQV